MNTNNLALTITLLLCISCSQNKAKQVEVNTDTKAVFSQFEISDIQKMTNEEANKILLGKMGVDTTSLSENMTDEQVEAAIKAIANYTANPNNKSLNEIRFGNWTEKDWYDNDYFQFLRKCIDDCLKGVENENTQLLQDYKSVIKGKFFIYDVEPYINGGLFITLGFLDKPEIVFQTVVYSYVNEDTGKITDYRLRGGFRELEKTSDITKEDILQIIKEHPENKLW